MNDLSPRSIFVALGAALLFSVSVFSQGGPPDGPPPERGMAGQGRPNLLKELGLSPEQVQQIRQMNQARRPLMDEAGARLREANRALDMAIYAENLNESDVAARLKDFQLAQAEVAKLRFRGELELRKILTLEQLAKFRALRERFGERRERRQEMRRNTPPNQRPLQRLRQLPKRGGTI